MRRILYLITHIITRLVRWIIRNIYKLIPRDPQFIPILKEMIGVVRKATNELRQFTSVSYPYSALEMSARVHKYEGEADKLLDYYNERLTRSILLPFPRLYMIQLGRKVEDLMNEVDDLGHSLDTHLVTTRTKEFSNFMDNIQHAVNNLSHMVNCLGLPRTQDNQSGVRVRLQHIRGFEHSGDEKFRHAEKVLFAAKKNNPENAIELRAWMGIYKNCEKVLDRCQDLAEEIAHALNVW